MAAETTSEKMYLRWSMPYRPQIWPKGGMKPNDGSCHILSVRWLS